MGIKDQIMKILEESNETEWGWNGEDEVPYKVFNYEAAATALEHLWESTDHGEPNTATPGKPKKIDITTSTPSLTISPTDDTP